MPQKIDMLPSESLERWFGGQHCEKCGGSADDHNVEVIFGHWSPRCLHPLPEGLTDEAKQAELAGRIARKEAGLPLIEPPAAASTQADVPNLMGATDAESELSEPDSRHGVSAESARGEVWAMKVFHGILRWSGLPGWEARVVRNSLVHQERLRDAFEAFDEGDYAAAFAAFKRDADTGSAVAQHNVGTLYEAGYGAPHSDEEAEMYYRLAAEQGLPEAQYGLGAILATDVVKAGFIHTHSNVVLTEDPRKALDAYKWLYIAKLRGKRNAKPALRRLRKAMSRDAVNEAEAAALGWQAEHMHLGRIQTRTGRKSRVREGIRRLAIVLGTIGALIVVAIMLVGKGDAPVLSNWLWLTALATAGAFVALWFPVRVIGWIVAGFFEDKPT